MRPVHSRRGAVLRIPSTRDLEQMAHARAEELRAQGRVPARVRVRPATLEYSNWSGDRAKTLAGLPVVEDDDVGFGHVIVEPAPVEPKEDGHGR